MTDLSAMLQQGAGNAWLFIPTAILLGALHGLEPGHSKTMMAAFIVAVRGTVGQAVLLGLAATLSHTAVVWAIALAGLYFGQHWDAEASEPYFQVASALMMAGVGAWMLVRLLRQQAACFHDHAQEHAHEHEHEHDHDHDQGHDHDHDHDQAHGPDHAPTHAEALTTVLADAQDDHERAHAEQIQRRFASGEVTTGQIVMFGLTGGLIPCPASITVLLLCLQLKRFTLGATLVLGFSVGLALTMVASGVVAAWGLRHAAARFGGAGGGFGTFARRAPYFSVGLIFVIAIAVGLQGARTLMA